MAVLSNVVTSCSASRMRDLVVRFSSYLCQIISSLQDRHQYALVLLLFVFRLPQLSSHQFSSIEMLFFFVRVFVQLSSSYGQLVALSETTFDLFGVQLNSSLPQYFLTIFNDSSKERFRLFIKSYAQRPRKLVASCSAFSCSRGVSSWLRCDAFS